MAVRLADKLIKGVCLVIEGERTRVARMFGRSIYSDETFMNSVCNSGLTPHELAESFRNRRVPRFFVNTADKETVLDEFGRQPEWSAESIVEDAEMLCRHRFSMLGVDDVELGNPIDWHRDFKSGARWRSGMYYKLVSRWQPNDRADIKVPWELSRFQHLPTLGKAYWLTGDERYAREFIGQVSDWTARNPVGFGVNWACTMDVAIRTVNWLWGWYFIKESPSVDERFVLSFLKSLWQHGVHIADNLEVVSFEGTKYKNNHYLTDVAGLVYLGLMLPEFSVAAEWFDTGMRALENEIRVQVNEDGPTFEQSVPYHRLALELFMYPAILCRLNGTDMSSGYMEMLERMVEFTAAYTKPDGTAPQIGDADDGRLHILSEYRHWNRRDHRYLIEVGAKLFGRDDFMTAAGREWEEAFWLTRGTDEQPVVSSRSEPYTLESRAFRSTGIFIMRHDDHYMAVTAGPVGTGGLGAHKHCDVLSFELCVGGTSYIVDPGSYVYTADPTVRNMFKSTAYHNTVQVDRWEQNGFDSTNVFLTRDYARPKLVRWESTDEYDSLEAEHYGFCRFPGSIVHNRRVYFDKKNRFWLIDDRMYPSEQADGSGTDQEEPHVFSMRFHFADMSVSTVQGAVDMPVVVRDIIERGFGVRADMVNAKSRVDAIPKTGMTLTVVPVLADGLTCDIEDGWVSYGYGTREKTKTVRFRKSGSTARFLTFIRIANK